MLDANRRQQIVNVTWHDDKPFEIICAKVGYADTYDVDWSRADDGYIHWSGCGPDKTTPAELETVAKLPREARTLDSFIEHYRLDETGTVICCICNDVFPDDDHCEHLNWSDDLGDWDGPGVCK